MTGKQKAPFLLSLENLDARCRCQNIYPLTQKAPDKASPTYTANYKHWAETGSE